MRRLAYREHHFVYRILQTQQLQMGLQAEDRICSKARKVLRGQRRETCPFERFDISPLKSSNVDGLIEICTIVRSGLT